MVLQEYNVSVIKPGVLKRDRFGNILDARSTVTLIRDEKLNIIVDTGLAEERQIILGALSQYELKPTDINVLINTHSHVDHTGNNDLFKHVHVINSHSEIEIAPNLKLLETPGHTRDSISVIVRGSIESSGPQNIIITGDALPIMDNYLKWVPPGINFDPEIALQSMTKIVECADIIIPGHDKPFRIIKNQSHQRRAEYL